MRFTNKLYAQHLGWTFKKHWQIQGKRVPRDTGAIDALQKKGILVKDASDVLFPKVERERMFVVGNKPQMIPEDHTNPNWHDTVAHIYKDSNVLLEGLPQSLVLTNTIEINGFPKNIEEAVLKMQFTNSIDRSVKNSIMASHVYDAQQVKLPKVKLVERPAFTLPRNYGISLERRNRLLVNKLLFQCEKLSGPSINSQRKIIDNADFKVTFLKDADIVQFDVSAEKIMTSSRPIDPIKGSYDGDLPDLHPIKCTITIPKKNIYTTDNVYSFSKSNVFSNPHTIFLHFNKDTVGNLHETVVTTTQFQSRTLLKAFAVAASRAKQLYGEDHMEKLPKPIVVQSIQTDGKTFHFGVLQLNSLSLSKAEGPKNFWFHQSNMDLFSECGYKAGRPTLVGYNKDVFRLLSAFYNNS